MMAQADMSAFIKTINGTDLARSNLFLVRFGDFRTTIVNDGVLDFDDDITLTGGTSSFARPNGEPYTWHDARKTVFNTGYKHLPHSAKKLLGASDDINVIQDLFGSGVSDFVGSNFRLNTDLALMCKSANLPSMGVEAETMWSDRKPFGTARAQASGNLRLTFYCSPNFIERRLMMMWLGAVRNQETNQFGFHDSYTCEIDVAPLDRQGRVQSVVACKGCFPINVGEVQLDFDNNNQVATFEVEFYVGTNRQVNTFLHSNLKAAL
ncbi:TPA: hypothetical protein I7702_16820 [Vibrio vulnificus]|nr:hypothetical protein [Vibrio vulnificus]HAS8460823.1 hypothetical protein [Vibrio vulnificus]